MDLKEQLEAIAVTNGWTSVYGRRDFQNLFDATAFVTDAIEGVPADETVMFIDPIKESTVETGDNVTGTFLLVTRSNHDKPYQERYTLFIKPLKVLIKSIYSQFRCSYDIIRWDKTEVINLFDLNADGYLISYQMNGYD